MIRVAGSIGVAPSVFVGTSGAPRAAVATPLARAAARCQRAVRARLSFSRPSASRSKTLGRLSSSRRRDARVAPLTWWRRTLAHTTASSLLGGLVRRCLGRTLHRVPAGGGRGSFVCPAGRYCTYGSATLRVRRSLFVRNVHLSLLSLYRTILFPLPLRVEKSHQYSVT